MNVKSRTRVFILATAAAWIAYDLYAYATGGGDATISTNLYEWGVEYPIIPFAAGVLVGHLWASMPGIKATNPDGPAAPAPPKPVPPSTIEYVRGSYRPAPVEELPRR